MQAYDTIFTETSRDYAPWYAIPADDKGTMRCIVADIIEQTLRVMAPQYPTLSVEEQANLLLDRKRLLKG